MTKYRIIEAKKTLRNGICCITTYQVQYKKFLFWHYFHDAYDDPINYMSLDDARDAISRSQEPSCEVIEEFEL